MKDLRKRIELLEIRIGRRHALPQLLAHLECIQFGTREDLEARAADESQTVTPAMREHCRALLQEAL